jgi:UDP-N-acetylglucosamine 4,6-dehydratase
MKNKEILITGGTGSLGKALTKALIPLEPKGIRIFSRSELNQFNMKQEFKECKIPISYMIGDIRDLDRLKMACKGVDYIVNTAAMKRIEVCDSDPLECVKTNVNGVQNIINAALDCNVKKVLQVSTDKAVYPTTLYGASKKVAEDLIINANVYSGDNKTKFMCVRYGNVLGSNGSVLGIFLKQIKNKELLTVTNSQMTRFWITLPNVCAFIMSTLKNHNTGIHIPKMVSSKILDLINSLEDIYGPQMLLKISSQTNEKIHESLTTSEESPRLEEVFGRIIIKENAVIPLDKQGVLNEYNSLSNYQGHITAKHVLTKMIQEVINEN